MMSWVSETVRGKEDKWIRSGMRFATKEEAQAACFKHQVRKDAFWAQGYPPVKKMRVVEVDEPVNYYFVDGYCLTVTDK